MSRDGKGKGATNRKYYPAKPTTFIITLFNVLSPIRDGTSMMKKRKQVVNPEKRGTATTSVST